MPDGKALPSRCFARVTVYVVGSTCTIISVVELFHGAEHIHCIPHVQACDTTHFV